MAKLSKSDQEHIAKLCKVIIETLATKKDGLEDSYSIKKHLDAIFLDKDERLFAYNYSYQYIKEQLDESHRN